MRVVRNEGRSLFIIKKLLAKNVDGWNTSVELQKLVLKYLDAGEEFEICYPDVIVTIPPPIRAIKIKNVVVEREWLVAFDWEEIEKKVYQITSQNQEIQRADSMAKALQELKEKDH